MSKTFETEDASLVTRVASEPIHFRNAQGNWQTIDNELVASAREGVAFRNRANEYTAELPRTLRDPIRVAVGGDSVELRMIDAAGDVVRTSGTTATYEDVVGDVEARWHMLASGVKEELVLASPRSASAFSYALNIEDGWVPRERHDGGIDLVDPAGQVQFVVEAPFMTDSSGRPDSSSRAVELDLDRRDGKLVVTMTADRRWLEASERKFPVVIDPTVTYAGPSARLNNALQATFVDSILPTTSFGSDPVLWAGDESSSTVDHRHRALLKFDVENAIPRYSSVFSATLGLYVTGRSHALNGCLHVHEAARTWTNDATWQRSAVGVPWGTAGGDYHGVVSENVTPAVGSWLYFNQLQDLAQRWVSQKTANYGVVVDECNTQKVSYSLASDNATDQTKVPYLELWYRAPTGAPENQTFLTPHLDGTEDVSSAQFPQDLADVNVNLASGALLAHAEDDGGTGADADLHLDRFYNFGDSSGSKGFGRGWSEGEGHWIKSTDQTDGSRVFNHPTMAPLRFTRRPDGTYAPPPFWDASMTRNADSSVTVGFNRSQTTYDEGGQSVASMSRFRDPDGAQATWTYDAADGTYGNKTRTSSTGTTTYTRAYQSHRITEIREPDGRVFTYTYNSNSRLETATAPGNKVTRYTWDAAWPYHLKTITAPDGTRTDFAYVDKWGSAHVSRVTRYSGPTDTTGKAWAFVYQDAGPSCAGASGAAGETVVTGPAGAVTSYCWNRDLEVIAVEESQTGEASAIDEIAAQGYASHFGVSVETAKAVHVLQGKADGLNEDITATAANSGYAGVWFDHGQRRIKVGLTQGTDAAPVLQVFAAHGISDSADVVRVASTQDRLEQERDRIAADLVDLVDASLITLSFRPNENAVVINVGTSATASQRSRIASTASSAAVDVRVVDAATPLLDFDLLACSRFACDPPMRGGLALRVEQGDFVNAFCTSGFVVRDTTVNRTPYVLTAGHCVRDFVRDFGNQRVVMARGGDDNGERIPNLVGFPSRWIFDGRGDFGLIGLNEASPYETTLVPWVFVSQSGAQGPTRRDPSYRIRRTRRNQNNTTVCISGFRSGTRCGNVVDLGVRAKGAGSLAQVEMYDCDDANVETQLRPGDSGGPVYKKGSALGLVSSKRGCDTFITGAHLAERELGVDILPE